MQRLVLSYLAEETKESLSVDLKLFLAQDEVPSKILLAHNGILGKHLGCTLEKNPSLEKQIGTVGYIERLLDIVVGDKNTDILVLELPHDILYILDSNGVDTCKRLIEHNELGVDGKASRNLGTATLASREAAAEILAYLLQTELLDKTLQLIPLVVLGCYPVNYCRCTFICKGL